MDNPTGPVQLPEPSQPAAHVESVSLAHKLFLFFEHPLFWGPIGIVGGLVGLFFYTPILFVCGLCILLAFLRAGVVSGLHWRKQLVAYIIVVLVSATGLYGLQVLIKKHAPDLGKDIAEVIVNRLRSEPAHEANAAKPDDSPSTSKPAEKYPQFGGEITAFSTGSVPPVEGTVLLVGGTITHSLDSPPSALMDWEVELEIGHKKIVGNPIQQPEADKYFPAAGEKTIHLPRANYWPSKCASPIGPGDAAIGWVWAAFPTLTIEDIYVKDAFISVGFKDALSGKWHHIRRPVPPKGVHVPPSI